MTEIANKIFRLTIPFLDIYTTVFVVDTPDGALLFDTATYPEDADNCLVPLIKELKLENDLKYVFISHKHRDHAGGLKRLLEHYPHLKVLSRGIDDVNCISPDDGDTVLGCLKVVTIPGHSDDCMAIFDTRTKTLISGDCLQLYGIYGSGEWGANIGLLPQHIDAINKLKNMDIDAIYTAHDYHPLGYRYLGKEEIAKALDMCIAPFMQIKKLMLEYPELDDVGISALYHEDDLPKVRIGVFAAVRESAEKSLI